MLPAIPPPKHCTYCSLLCELPEGQDDFGATYCSRRQRELGLVDENSRSIDFLQSAPLWEERLSAARRAMAGAKRILVTGRIHSLESARGAIAWALCHHAVLDPWESDDAFSVLLAIQRSGMHSISLAEARDRTELLIVIGTDRLLDDTPRMPQALAGRASIPLLLIGDWSSRARDVWKQAGFRVVSIPAPLENIPRGLLQLDVASETWEAFTEIGRWLTEIQYTTVLWSMQDLRVAQSDLWVESMFGWIAARNETRRCSALVWGDLGGTFHQVCTWWTGYPGRIRCSSEPVEYDPWRYRASRWLNVEDRESLRSAAVLWIDDSRDGIPISLVESGVPIVVASPGPVDESRGEVTWLPCQRPGLGKPCELFRGDQAVLIRGQDPSTERSTLPTAAQWLQGWRSE